MIATRYDKQNCCIFLGKNFFLFCFLTEKFLHTTILILELYTYYFLFNKILLIFLLLFFRNNFCFPRAIFRFFRGNVADLDCAFSFPPLLPLRFLLILFHLYTFASSFVSPYALCYIFDTITATTHKPKAKRNDTIHTRTRT